MKKEKSGKLTILSEEEKDLIPIALFYDWSKRFFEKWKNQKGKYGKELKCEMIKTLLLSFVLSACVPVYWGL